MRTTAHRFEFATAWITVLRWLDGSESGGNPLDDPCGTPRIELCSYTVIMAVVTCHPGPSNNVVGLPPLPTFRGVTIQLMTDILRASTTPPCAGMAASAAAILSP